MRSFIAIEVPPLKSIQHMQRSIDGRVKLVEPANIHLTLKFLGDIDEKIVPEIGRVIEACKIPPFKITLKNVGFFPNDRYVKVIWVGVDDGGRSAGLMRCIDEGLARLKFKKERSYVPHVTVARAKGRINTESLNTYRNRVFGEFVAKEIKLKKSTLTERGPIYEDIAVFSLD